MPLQASIANSNGIVSLQMARNVLFSRQDDNEMRVWLNRLALALLAASVMQAGIVACCGNMDNLNPGTRQQSPHDPCEPQPCCSPSFAVQAVAPQLPIRWERASLVDSGVAVASTSGQNIRTLLALSTAYANRHNAVPWVPQDLLARIQVFLI